jgi:hypothetical protein
MLGILCAMTPKERAAAQVQLSAAMQSLKQLAAARGNVLDDKRNLLLRDVIDLRRTLTEDADQAMDEELAGMTRGRRADDDIDRPFPSAEDHAPAARSWLSDFTLHPIARLVISGMCILAWVIQPEPSDSAVATGLLMFLRSVPIFIVGGSACGRAATGALVGVAIFFALMWAVSVSLVMWDAHLPSSSMRLVQHATRLANLLYLLGGLGLILCIAMTVALHRRRWMISQRYFRMSMQVLAIVQLAIVLELGYTGLRHAIGADQKNVGTIQALMKFSHKTAWHR